MAISSHGEVRTSAAAAEGKYTVQLALIVALFGGIGFITAMNDVLVPHFKDLFQLTNVKALLVQFAFFGAYFLLAIPSGKIVGRIGYRNGMIAAMAQGRATPRVCWPLVMSTWRASKL